MDSAKNHIHHHSPLGTDSSAPGMRYDLSTNPIAFTITLVVALLALSVLLVVLIEYIHARLALDTTHEQEGKEGKEDDTKPWSITITEDGTLIGEEFSSRRARQYGTFHTENGVWYDADGTEMNYSQWVENVYDPLD